MFSSKFRSSYTIWLAAIHIPANSSKTLSATQVIKPPLATARAAACNRTVHLFVCPFVCLSNYLSPNAKNAIFSKLSNLDAYWRPIGSHAWAFQKPIIVPLKFKMAEIRHLENRHYVIFFCRWWSDLDKISQTGAEWHVDCGDMIEIGTRSRIPIWRTFVRIQCMSSQSHVSRCRVLPLGEFTVIIPEPHATLQGAAICRNQCHHRATL